MAFGVGEDSARLPVVQLEGVEFPAWRDAIVRVAAENGAAAEVINFFKCLPRGRYESKREVLRDFAEAARRMAMGGNADEDDGIDRDRRNLGRDAMEGQHP
ncbi:MAG: DUF2795 domain-containing protein [Myxococcaceae bacterium]